MLSHFVLELLCSIILATDSTPVRGGGYPRQFFIGVYHRGSQTLTLFKGRKSRIDTLLKAQNQEMVPYSRETR